jgi:3-hydroxybutyryl-CoA dehydrogenase
MAIETIAVIGATDSGCEIARFSLAAGYRVILVDISLARLEEGIAAVWRMLNSDLARDDKDSAMTRNRPERLLGVCSVEEAVREGDLIIEAVADEEEMKLELFTIFDKFAKPGAIFASTTNLFSISGLAEITFCPERCIGMRLAAAVSGVRKVELVRGKRTSDETVAACGEAGRRMNLGVEVILDEETLSARDD